MTVVIDCNILVMCLTSRSPFHTIFTALVSGNYKLAVNADIVLEYVEIIQEKYGNDTANSFLALLTELPNVKLITTYYKWQLITADPDDNKYCDCAVAGQADYIVTEDKHFDTLRNISFPPLTTISIKDFTNLLTK